MKQDLPRAGARKILKAGCTQQSSPPRGRAAEGCWIAVIPQRYAWVRRLRNASKLLAASKPRIAGSGTSATTSPLDRIVAGYVPGA